MPKGLKGFQKGHKGFLTKEQYKKIGKKVAETLRIKFKGRTLNTGRTHFKDGHGMNKGKENPMYKGGRWKNKDGYILILKHGHPMARPSGYILEHRFIMSEHCNRILDRDEIVHHINGIKDDNRIENLEIMPRGDHSILHCSKNVAIKCMSCGHVFKDSPSRKNRRKYCSRKCYIFERFHSFPPK